LSTTGGELSDDVASEDIADDKGTLIEDKLDVFVGTALGSELEPPQALIRVLNMITKLTVSRCSCARLIHTP